MITINKFQFGHSEAPQSVINKKLCKDADKQVSAWDRAMNLTDDQRKLNQAKAAKAEADGWEYLFV